MGKLLRGTMTALSDVHVLTEPIWVRLNGDCAQLTGEAIAHMDAMMIHCSEEKKVLLSRSHAGEGGGVMP